MFFIQFEYFKILLINYFSSSTHLTNFEVDTLVPLPNCPYSFLPAPYTSPVAPANNVNPFPKVTFSILPGKDIFWGIGYTPPTSNPSPNCQYSL